MKNILAGAMLAAVVTMAGAGAATAQVYPDRPITIINPNSAGGTSDLGIRTYQPFIEACLGNGAVLVPVSIPGAGAAIGLTTLAGSPADGYVVGSANMPNLVLGIITGTVEYKVEDFVFFGALIGSNASIGVRIDSPFTTAEQWIDSVKTAGGVTNVGISGIGADDHLAGLKLEQQLGVDFNFIPFGSGADARNALLGQQVDVSIVSTTNLAQFTDQVRVLAVAGDARSPYFADVPTFKELGYDVVGGSTHLVSAPAETPADIVEKWRACVAETGANPDFLAAAAERGIGLNVLTADEAAAYAANELAQLTALWESDPWIK